MIGILDYGLGNIKAFGNVYKSLNIRYKFISKVEDFNEVTKIILPGVGSFDYAMNKLNKSGLRYKLEELVLESKLLVIGVCVGLHMLAHNSEEGGEKGLCWIDAQVKKFKGSHLPLPHMGWNNIEIKKEHGLLHNLTDNSEFYFLHSYYFETDEKNVLATSNYIKNFDCIINHRNIYGIQCHPEKSHYFGLQLLKNFGVL